MKFQNPDFKSTNYYQLKKLLEFLTDLQLNLFLRTFSNVEFQSLILIPKIQFRKCEKQKCWLAKVYITEEYYFYSHLFIFPDLFQEKYKKDEFKVRFEVLKKFISEENIEKKF